MRATDNGRTPPPLEAGIKHEDPIRAHLNARGHAICAGHALRALQQWAGERQLRAA